MVLADTHESSRTSRPGSGENIKPLKWFFLDKYCQYGHNGQYDYNIHGHNSQYNQYSESRVKLWDISQFFYLLAAQVLMVCFEIYSPTYDFWALKPFCTEAFSPVSGSIWQMKPCLQKA